MTVSDEARLQRARDVLRESDLDGLICRLPEDVLMLSGYWPMNGFGLLIFPTEGEPVLLAPEAEAHLAADAWVSDVRAFPWGLVDSGDLLETMARLTKQLVADLHLRGRRVGYEGSLEFIAAPHVRAEPNVISGRTILFVDESGFRPLPAVVRTYARRGPTPSCASG